MATAATESSTAHRHLDEVVCQQYTRSYRNVLAVDIDMQIQGLHLPPIAIIAISLHTSRPNLLHLKPVFRFRLILHYSPFLEEHVRRIVDRTRTTRCRATLLQECIDHTGLNPCRSASREELILQVTAELRFSVTMLSQVYMDLASDLQDQC